MAGRTFTINFDTGIEKVEYSTSFNQFPTGEATTSGQTVASPTDFYVRPIFKQGYELDSTNVAPTGTNGIYTCLKDGVFIKNVTFTSKQSTPQPTLIFKHFFDAGTIGSGTVKFRHYLQQEPSSGETWVLNETYNGSTTASYDVNFTSNGESFAKLSYGDRPRWFIKYGETNVYFNGTWTNAAYRTITFATLPTGDLLTWLQANGTKQGGVTLINFTIDGTTYQAEEGMTWQEWVNSSYNTYGCTIEGSSVKGKGNNGLPTYIYINQNLNLTLVSSTDSIIKNATYEDAAGGAGN